MGTNTDITAYRQLELAREQTLKEAERLASLKQAFLANMSHEIRTPLNAILGLTQIGRRDYDTAPPGQLFRRIDQAGRHLLGLLNDVLDYSRIEAGKLRIAPEPFRLADCLAEVQSIISSQASAKALALRVEPAADLPDWLEGDALRLRQILINLLGNVVKFTEHGEVRLSVHDADGALCFEVIDTGIGMTDEQILRVFQPFEQARLLTPNFSHSHPLSHSPSNFKLPCAHEYSQKCHPVRRPRDPAGSLGFDADRASQSAAHP